jgi:AcrR family transcriptional regulator
MRRQTAGAEASRLLTRKGRETRERIVVAASGLMFERGVVGTSTEEIQAMAGVSASQLYHYFADKHEVVRAVIAHQTDAILDAQEPLLSNLDSIESLRSWRDFIVGLQRERECRGGCPIGSLGSELADEDEEARRDLVTGFDRWEVGIRGGLRAMDERGELAPGADPDQLALSILVALQGGLLLTQIRRDPSPLEAGLDAMIDHIALLRREP